MKLNERFWDCECTTNYIHPKHIERCSICYAKRDDQPDSREDEVDELFNKEKWVFWTPGMKEVLILTAILWLLGITVYLTWLQYCKIN